MTTEQAIARQAAHENLQKELVRVLESVLKVIDESEHWWIDCPNRGGFDVSQIVEVLAKAKEQA